ncbi:DUF502 domain-containing protein [Litoribacter ruber]|uniref:DUF502 domain-containing protein n=1 Tax=Litoribacter ruber TaxID=702568 RepID=A0AAP2G311_9BACT|nr:MULTISPECIES: DUF502 domain-containing protein [Litoribacter]MBS9522576.1 DUF502 domain-containing protein [Litoribacter alkaliphilus]MBT0811107.1 DUF502 domain-containing protein [Litoribacter ruber]
MSSFTTRRFLKYFLRGLLFVVPLALTIYIIFSIVVFLDSIIPLPVPGLGILIMLAFITFVGYMASIFVTRPIFDLVEKWLFKIPLVNIVYTSIKDLMQAFVGDKKKFNVTVTVKLSDNMYRLGFLTQEDMAMIEEPGLAAVYFPHSYNFSGNLYMVPKENIKIVENINNADVMKFIVSGGVSELQRPEESFENTIKK